MTDKKDHSDICFKCYESGNSCCKDVKLGILYEEPAYDYFIKAETEKTFPKGHNLRQRFTDWDKDGKEIWDEDATIYDSGHDYCFFFDKETAKCSIYEDRPMLCKTFPNVWQNQHTIFIDLLCLLSHTTPLKEISDMTKPYLDEIAKVPFYNGEKWEPKYLNIRKLKSSHERLKILDDL